MNPLLVKILWRDRSKIWADKSIPPHLKNQVSEERGLRIMRVFEHITFCLYVCGGLMGTVCAVAFVWWQWKTIFGWLFGK